MVDVNHENCASYSDIKSAMEDGSIVVIDVRNSDEIAASGKIQSKRWMNVPYKNEELEAALQLPEDEFEKRYGGKKPLEDGADVVFNCGSGKRSSRAVAVALTLGYPNARHYAGGLKQWKLDTAAK